MNLKQIGIRQTLFHKAQTDLEDARRKKDPAKVGEFKGSS